MFNSKIIRILRNPGGCSKLSRILSPQLSLYDSEKNSVIKKVVIESNIKFSLFYSSTNNYLEYKFIKKIIN